MKNAEEFMKKYHVAVARANMSQLDKIKPKIASELINEWMAEVGGSITDEDEFKAKFEEFLTDGLGFADESKVTIAGDELTIDVGAVSYTHLRAHETRHDIVCRLLLEKKKNKQKHNIHNIILL